MYAILESIVKVFSVPAPALMIKSLTVTWQPGNMKNSAVRFLKMSTIIILKIGKRSSRVPISSSAESPLSAWIGF